MTTDVDVFATGAEYVVVNRILEGLDLPKKRAFESVVWQICSNVSPLELFWHCYWLYLKLDPVDLQILNGPKVNK